MPIANIPLFSGQDAAIIMGDESGEKEHHGSLRDVYVDELGTIHRRPGLTEYSDLSTSSPIDGLFWWNAQDWVLSASNGNTYKVTDKNGSNTQITHDNTDWAKSGRVVFADFKTAIYGADRFKIKKITSSANVIDMADSSAPTTVSHVAFIDKYLLANNLNSAQCHRSDVNDPDTWGSNYFSPETQNDYLNSVIVANQEVYLMGERTLEFWYDDGATPFIREEGGFINSGTNARYSFGYCEPPIDNFCWLDHNRVPVMISGRNTTPISGTIAKYIQDFDYVDDCRGDYIVIDGRPYYIFSFPSENECLVWDFGSKLWYKWGYWNSVKAGYDRWRANCFCSVPEWDYLLAGDGANGKIYRIDNSVYQDDSDTIRSLVRTGRVTHEYSGRKKKCKGINLRVKRSALSTGTKKILIRYRNDGQTDWHNWKEISLTQNTGTTESIITYRKPLGMYYNRQWEIVVTDNIGISIVGMQEDFDYL